MFGELNDSETASAMAPERVERISTAISAVLRRLSDLSIQWKDAQQAYFEPSAFRRLVQTAITTSRSVTFILQSHKAAIPGFETWYGTWTDRWTGDPTMQWAKNARNKIEKQGDLETLSQLRVWFALDATEPLAFFAGIWTPHACVRKIKSGWEEVEAYGFLTTESAEPVVTYHDKAMPVLLTTPEEWDLWLSDAGWSDVAGLQKPLPNRLIVVPAPPKQ